MTAYTTEIERYFTVKEQAHDYRIGGQQISYTAFMEMYDHSDLRMEYINGEIVPLASPSAVHQDIAGNLYIQLRTYLKENKCKVFFAPFYVHFYKKGIDTPDVMQPDLLVACDFDEKVNEQDRYMGTPTLCMEILSKSTRTKDMIDKLNTYMLSGVQEFWIIDPDKQSVLVYQFDDYSISEYTAYKANETIQSQCFERLVIAVNTIFET